MEECPYCKSEVTKEETHCPECGEALEEAWRAKKRTPVLTIGDDGKRRSPDSFTKEDLVEGLRTAAEGTPMEGFLPSEQWEDYTASLLEVLFDKHLVFPAEIDRELKPEKKDE